MISRFAGLLAALWFAASLVWAGPPIVPREKFAAYIQRAEESLQREVSSETFLWAAMSDLRLRRVRAGEIVVEPVNKSGTIDIGRALVHDWRGAMFIPGVKLDHVTGLLQDYGSHKNYFRPEVVDSRLISRNGGEYKLYYRIVKKKLITIVVNSEHTATYVTVSPTRMYSNSHTTRIAEVEHAGKSNEREVPPEVDPGVFWQLNTYWRWEERDGGVYVECQSVTLTCTVPLGLGWLINPIIRALPGESLAYLLEAARKAVLSRPR